MNKQQFAKKFADLGKSDKELHAEIANQLKGLNDNLEVANKATDSAVENQIKAEEAAEKGKDKAEAYDEAVTKNETLTAELSQANINLNTERSRADAAEMKIEVAESTASDAVKAKEEAEALIDSTQATALEDLHKENLELKAKLNKDPNKDRYVDGKFKSTAKKTKGKVYTFKDGWVKTRLKNGSILASVDCLKDAEVMEWLIEIGYNGLEIVE